MQRLVGYHRPGTIADAVELLRAPDRMPLAGGTTFVHDGGATPVEVVDLQALGLDGIAVTGEDGDLVRIGATVTLLAVCRHAAIPDLVRRCATAELPSTLRSLATVGGTVGAAEPGSVLLAALLVHEAVVGFADGRTEPLGTVLRDGVGSGSLVVDVTVANGGTTAMAGTGRTPADEPIVAAVARHSGGRVHLALTGVAPTPVLVDPSTVDALDPPADFRGSTGYRRHLAGVLAARAIGAVS